MGFGSIASAQLTIDDCQQQAKENYPLIRKYDLIRQSKNYNLSNVAKAWLPQVQLNARATYQSEVTKIPIDFSQLGALGSLFPEIPTPTKDQYQVTIEASQVIWDGGAIRSQRKLAEAGSEVESQQLEVEMYALEDRVNQLFFGILLCDAQLEQNRFLTDELQRNVVRVQSFMESGVANQSDLDVVRIEQLNAKQVRTQIQSARRAYVEMLGLMLGQELPENMVLVKPDINNASFALAGSTRNLRINRPELQFFSAQARLFDAQKALIKSSFLPKLGLFLQGGYGRPGLNMLSDEFDAFYIGGVRLSWNFGALYTQKNDLRKIEVNKNAVDTQKDFFLYNIRLSASRENQELQRLHALMQDDDEIVSLRENIRKSAEAKVENGTLTVTDLMRELTQENIARQTKTAHEIDLLRAIYNLRNVTN
jgi:outer membrane protein TolC